MDVQGYLKNEILNNKMQAVKNVLSWIGFKDVDSIQIENDMYIYKSKRGKIKKFLVFSGWNKYFKWHNENQQLQKKMFKCLGFEVVLLND